jgi:putative transposase
MRLHQKSFSCGTKWNPGQIHTMVHYRRNRIRGGTFFFTITLADRRSRMLVEHADLLREAFRILRREHPFQIEVIAVLPDHLHAIWKLPQDDDDYPGRWRAIKSRFTHMLRTRGAPLIPSAKGEYRLWARRYWEHTIRDDDDFQKHAEYIHYNPVKHGLVNRASDWPFSSFHRYVRLGRLSPDWGCEPPGGDFGE